MSEPIKVGDLVQVVRPHPCPCATEDKTMGIIFTVADIKHGGSICGGCGRDLPIVPIAIRSGRHGVAAHRLKRIPPLEELRDVKRDEVITA
jgi:hypothetical protein